MDRKIFVSSLRVLGESREEVLEPHSLVAVSETSDTMNVLIVTKLMILLCFKLEVHKYPGD